MKCLELNLYSSYYNDEILDMKYLKDVLKKLNHLEKLELNLGNNILAEKNENIEYLGYGIAYLKNITHLNLNLFYN